MPSVYIPSEFEAEQLMALYLMGYGDGLWGHGARVPSPVTYTRQEVEQHAYDRGFDKGTRARNGLP